MRKKKQRENIVWFPGSFVSSPRGISVGGWGSIVSCSGLEEYYCQLPDSLGDRIYDFSAPAKSSVCLARLLSASALRVTDGRGSTPNQATFIFLHQVTGCTVLLTSGPFPSFPTRIFLTSVPPGTPHRWYSMVSCGVMEGRKKLFTSFGCSKSFGFYGDHGKEQKLGILLFKFFLIYIFFLSFSFSSSTNSLRLKKPKVKFVLILNLPLCLPCNFPSMA